MAAVSERKKRELFSLLSSMPYPRLKEAAEQAGLAPQSVWNLVSEDPAWDASWKAAREKDQAERRAQSREVLESLLHKAVEAAGAALESDEDRVKLQAAWKIIEHLLGTARQNVEVTTDGEPFRFTIPVGTKAADE